MTIEEVVGLAVRPHFTGDADWVLSTEIWFSPAFIPLDQVQQNVCDEASMVR